jgi:2-polyprenyl-3-methyl-5-hydroxy-6-metoxy-1,4-benzoquinol methylase
MSRTMNVRHRELTDWGFSHLTFKANDQILDVGCGGGQTVQELARLAPNGKIVGIDYASASVQRRRLHKRRLNR